MCNVCEHAHASLDFRRVAVSCQKCKAPCRKGFAKPVQPRAGHCAKDKLRLSALAKSCLKRPAALQPVDVAKVPFIMAPQQKTLQIDKVAKRTGMYDWAISTPPVRTGVAQPLAVKRLALHMYHNLQEQVKDVKGGKIAYNQMWNVCTQKAAVKKKQRNIRRNAAKELHKHRARIVTAELLGVHGGTLRKWHAEMGRGELSEPVRRGMRKVSLEKYAAAYGDLVAWAESLEASAKSKGHGLTWQDIAQRALQDKEFAALEQERQQVYAQAMDLVMTVAETTVSEVEDLTCPRSLLNAMGIGEEPVEDPILQKLAWRFKRVLGRLGFGCESLVRESLKAVVGKISWTTKSCLNYYAFLTDPQANLDKYLVFLDESFFYAGEAERQAVVSHGDRHIAEKGGLQTIWAFGCIDCVLAGSW